MNEVRRDGLLRVLVMLLVKGSLLVIGVMSGKINGILICDPELFVTFGKLLTKGMVSIGKSFVVMRYVRPLWCKSS